MFYELKCLISFYNSGDNYIEYTPADTYTWRSNGKDIYNVSLDDPVAGADFQFTPSGSIRVYINESGIGLTNYSVQVNAISESVGSDSTQYEIPTGQAVYNFVNGNYVPRAVGKDMMVAVWDGTQITGYAPLWWDDSTDMLIHK